MLLSRKPVGIFVIWLLCKYLQENNREWARNWKEQNKNTKHNYLQKGQSNVVGKKAVWNIRDLVGVKIPIRKKYGMSWKLKQTKKAQLLTKYPRRCCWRGSRLEYLWSCCCANTCKKKIVSELEIERNKIKTQNTNTYK